jgi:hypothetical protein
MWLADSLQVLLKIRDPDEAIGAARDFANRGLLPANLFEFDATVFCRLLVQQCPDLEQYLFSLRFPGVVYNTVLIGCPGQDLFCWQAMKKAEPAMLTIIQQLHGDEAKLKLMLMG